MTDLALPAAPARPAATGAAARLAQAWRRLRRRRRAHLDSLRLHDLDDHLLRDIGIRRGDIATVIRTGRDAY